jgi:hypothetical protein
LPLLPPGDGARAAILGLDCQGGMRGATLPGRATGDWQEAGSLQPV